MTLLKCADYELQTYPEDWSPCHCPVCGGFLKAFLPNESFTCKKCGTELLIIPEEDEGEQMEWGKICPISQRKEKQKQ